MEKKVYVTPEVTKVEFDAHDRITASGCWQSWGIGPDNCWVSDCGNYYA